uniref:Uncharacterized protein n=1 Tax=Globisporangium ultimum (strain ATCC 200006 / CBS 805.95 / DAOM BR144) TaxID=431595 RepID=K3X3A4_GLOUD
MKDAQIRDSLWYLTERMRFLNASTPHDETSRWMTPSGRFCMLKLDRTIFETTKSTREVFQTLVHYFFNREIIISEVTGELTLRIDDSPWDQGVFQSRTVSNMAGDVQVESNSAMCSTFYDQYDDYGGGRPFGVITHEFVDVDELYPYSPVERVRNDVTGVLTVTSETRMRTNAVGGREDELVIVLTRTCLLQLHFDDVPLSPHAVQELQNSVCKWGDVMLASVKETVARQDASFIEQVTDSTRK